MNTNEVQDYISNLTADDATTILTTLKDRERKQKEEHVKSIVAEHESYVGKCYYIMVKPYDGMFPEMKKYFKIISARGSNEYRMSALTFYEHPLYWFDYNSSRIGIPGDYFLGEYEFESIQVEDFEAFCFRFKNDYGWTNLFINDMTEISTEEYNAAMNKYIEELQSMNWVADHYRFGGKMPSDPDWERKD